jgi:aspartate carbamoyltransferase catalytic subunit
MTNTPKSETTPEKTFQRKHLLGLEELSADEIRLILETTRGFKDIFTRSVKKVPTLRGKTVVNLFFENSTRTRTSFELAAKRLSADVVNFAVSTSSVSKGETLLDTVRTIEAMGADFVVMRHNCSGSPWYLSQRIQSSVLNAGDGTHEHPTQGLLDAYTILEKKGRFEGLKVVILGDILHSRVARSNMWALTKLGAEVVLCGPKTLIPDSFRKIPGVHISYDREEAIRDADVINLLRIQLERQQRNLFPSIREYRCSTKSTNRASRRPNPTCSSCTPARSIGALKFRRESPTALTRPSTSKSPTAWRSAWPHSTSSPAPAAPPKPRGNEIPVCMMMKMEKKSNPNGKKDYAVFGESCNSRGMWKKC